MVRAKVTRGGTSAHKLWQQTPTAIRAAVSGLRPTYRFGEITRTRKGKKRKTYLPRGKIYHLVQAGPRRAVCPKPFAVAGPCGLKCGVSCGQQCASAGVHDARVPFQLVAGVRKQLRTLRVVRACCSIVLVVVVAAAEQVGAAGQGTGDREGAAVLVVGAPEARDGFGQHHGGGGVWWR